MTPYQSEGPSPTLPTYRGKEEKGKIVENQKGECNWANKKALDLLLIVIKDIYNLRRFQKSSICCVMPKCHYGC